MISCLKQMARMAIMRQLVLMHFVNYCAKHLSNRNNGVDRDVLVVQGSPLTTEKKMI